MADKKKGNGGNSKEAIYGLITTELKSLKTDVTDIRSDVREIRRENEQRNTEIRKDIKNICTSCYDTRSSILSDMNEMKTDIKLLVDNKNKHGHNGNNKNIISLIKWGVGIILGWLKIGGGSV